MLHQRQFKGTGNSRKISESCIELPGDKSRSFLFVPGCPAASSLSHSLQSDMSHRPGAKDHTVFPGLQGWPGHRRASRESRSCLQSMEDQKLPQRSRTWFYPPQVCDLGESLRLSGKEVSFQALPSCVSWEHLQCCAGAC